MPTRQVRGYCNSYVMIEGRQVESGTRENFEDDRLHCLKERMTIR
jgi:hypothetical protein